MSASIRDWAPVSRRVRVDETERIRLDTGGREYRYYLLWIVQLPEQNRAAIQELSLYR